MLRPAIRPAGLAALALGGLLAAQTGPFVNGLEAYHRGDYPAAERNFRASIQQGGDPRAGTFLALVQSATGRCADAEPVLATAADAHDATMARLAGLALARCQMSAGRLDDAAATLRKVRAANPSDADVLYEAARLQMRAWNDTIRQLYEKNPSSFRVNQLSGEILETQGQFAEAAGEYRKAIAKNPQALNLHFELARALLNSSHSAEALSAALAEIDAELKLNPMDAAACLQAARILQVQQRPDEASARLERALQLRPDFPEALVALGTLRNEQHRSSDAIPLLEKAVRLAPASESGRYALMMAYRDAGRMDDARREKAELDRLQKSPEGEFTEFLKKLGDKPPVHQ